jgi:hypothetical protein
MSRFPMFAAEKLLPRRSPNYLLLRNSENGHIQQATISLPGEDRDGKVDGTQARLFGQKDRGEVRPLELWCTIVVD